MSHLSDYLENKFADHALGTATFTPASSLSLKLYTTAPTDSAGGTEVTGGDYAALVISNDTTNFPPCADTGVPTKTNGAVFQFPTADAAWGSVTHWALWDSGNMYCWGTVSPTNVVSSGDMPKFEIGKLTIALSNGAAGGLTESVRRSLLDLAFGRVAYSAPSAVYAEVGSLSAGVYTPTVNVDSSFVRAAATYGAASGGVASNTGSLQLSPAVTEIGLTLNAFAIFDDSSSGTMIASGSLSTPRSPVVGEIVQFNPGGLPLTLQ